MKKITFLTFFLFFLSITQAQAQPTDTETESICVSGFDSDPLTITLTPSDLTVNQGQQITAVSVSSATLGSSSYWGNWYDATITVTGGVSDGSAVTIANMAGLDLTGFTSITMTSEDLDVYSDSVTMCLNLDVTWELPTISADESVCVSGFDSDPLTITLTPSDLTVNQGQQITAVSVSSATLGSSSYWGNWYDATITVTGGVSDGSAVTIANMAGLDLTGFTSITMTSEDLDVYSDSVTMCLILGVTYVEPSCTSPSDITFSNITASSADISWTAGGSETDYEYVVQAAGTGEPVAAGTAVTGSTSVTISGLDSGTDYEIYVRSDCGDGLFSVWTGPSTFTTQPACGDTVTYCYDNGTSRIFDIVADNVGDYVTVTVVSGSTEASYDDLVVYDTADDSGNELYRANGDHSGQVITSTTGVISVYVIADTSVNCLSSTTIDSLVMDITCTPPPACLAPTDVTLSNITTTGLDISWTAPGGSETAFEFEVVPYGDPEPTSGASVSAAVTSVQETGLMAGTAYDVYVRSVCGGDYSAWSTAVSFYTACEVATGAFTNDFDTHNAGLVSDAACWAVENGGSANGWSTGDDGLGNTFWFINWDSSVAHDDALYSPAFSVVDGLTDGISFDSWNESASWTEIIDVEVWDDTLNNFLGYLAEDLAPPTDQTSYVYDLSAYEGQSVRIAFYIATLDLYRIYVDNFVVDSYAALGVEEASMAQFTYFPNPVNDVLTIKAQKAVEDITVFNMLGQVVKQQTPNTMDCTVDLSAMQSGAYFVQVSIDNTVETVRVLKK